MRILFRNTHEYLTVTYIAALSLIALLTVSSQVVIHSALGIRSNDSHIINIAGRQRMLSQRIAKEILLLQSMTETATYEAQLEQLRQSLGLWVRSHYNLRNREGEANSAAVNEMFNNLEPYFQGIYTAAQNILSIPPGDSIAVSTLRILENEGRFLYWMDEISLQYEREANQHVEDLKYIELTLMMFTLGVLFLEAFLVFRPAARTVSKSLKDIARAEQEKSKAILGELSTGLTHEIKNLLGPIAFVEAVKDEISKEKQEYIRYVCDSRDRIIALIDEVNLLAKGGEINYKIQASPLASIIDECVNLAKLDSDVKHTTLVTKHKCSGQAMLDKHKLVQVLLNLIRNAAHALGQNPAGRIVVETTCECAKKRAWVHIRDNGDGIPQEYIEQIWQPFFTTKGDKGTGLGLRICKNIIENHGGEILCRSEPGKGTTFSFSLPLSAQAC